MNTTPRICIECNHQQTSVEPICRKCGAPSEPLRTDQEEIVIRAAQRVARLENFSRYNIVISVCAHACANGDDEQYEHLYEIGINAYDAARAA